MSRIFGDAECGNPTYASDGTPPVSVEERNGEILLTAELPGLTEDQVEISLENNVLTISGEKRECREQGEAGGKFHLVERGFGSFRRSFTLPRTIRADGITAEVARPMLRRWFALLTLALPVACADPQPVAPDRTESTWTTELQYEFGDALEGDAVFHIIRSVRVDRDSERVFVLEPGLSRVSVWTPDGTLLFDVGRPGVKVLATWRCPRCDAGLIERPPSQLTLLTKVTACSEKVAGRSAPSLSGFAGSKSTRKRSGPCNSTIPKRVWPASGPLVQGPTSSSIGVDRWRTSKATSKVSGPSASPRIHRARPPSSKM